MKVRFVLIILLAVLIESLISNWLFFTAVDRITREDINQEIENIASAVIVNRLSADSLEAYDNIEDALGSFFEEKKIVKLIRIWDRSTMSRVYENDMARLFPMPEPRGQPWTEVSTDEHHFRWLEIEKDPYILQVGVLMDP